MTRSLDPEHPTWDDLISHPAEEGRPAMALETHLLGVADRSRRVTPPDAETSGGRPLAEVAAVTSLAHDFGKATSGFQARLDGKADSEGLGETHARLGGFAAYYVLQKRGFEAETNLAAFTAVVRHHGDIPDIERLLKRFSDDSWWEGGATGAALDQAEDIGEYAPEFASALFDEMLAGADGSWQEFREWLVPDGEQMQTQLLEDYYRGSPTGPTIPPVDDTVASGATYADTVRLYGTLAFADKTHAAGVDDDDDRLNADPLSSEQVRAYIDQLGGEEAAADEDGLTPQLNRLRGDIQTHLDGQYGDDPVTSFLNSDSDVATLTLPTGYGKTLAGLLTATRIREATGGDRIVYALPFTSIIDQTADVLRDVLTGDGDPAWTRTLTVHHHLVETLTLPDDSSDEAEDGDEDVTDATAGEDFLLAESWLAGVTLTTFVQLFESLAGPQNAESTKLPGLYNSVVIVDEPQAIPLEWWPLVRRLIRMLTNQFNATVVLMTATQPRIVDDSETYPLLTDDLLKQLENEQFDQKPSRVNYRFDRSVREGEACLSHSDAGTRLADDVAGSTTSALAICNTIDSAEALHDAVLEQFGDGALSVADHYVELCLQDGQVGAPPPTSNERATRERAELVRRLVASCQEEPVVAFLSTRLRPCDRRFLVAVASDLAGEAVPVLVVSTQLVEAGVDVSFDCVYRDFAPLDNIVQAAGRCNRSFERGLGAGGVNIWQLEPPGDRSTPPGEAVYGRPDGGVGLDLITRTRNVLGEITRADEPVSESRIAVDGVEQYHDNLGQLVSQMSRDNELYEAFENARGDVLRRASLIDEHLSFELYVCRTDADRQRVEQLEHATDYDEISDLRDDLAELRVSVPVYRGDSDAASILKSCPPLMNRSHWADSYETERVLVSSRDRDYFDSATGVDIPEPSAERRFK